MIVSEVYCRGDAHTPARFWDYALRTSTLGHYARDLHEMGFRYSKEDTELFNSLSDEEKAKVQFLYIDGVKQI